MKFAVFFKLTLISWLFSSSNCQQETSNVKIHGKSFFFLPPIIPLNSFTKRRRQSSQKHSCVGDCGLQGICTTKADCASQEGTPSGLCSDNVICCINYRTCGSNSSSETTYFVNPNFPKTYNEGSHCTLKVVKANLQICQLRVDFKEFSLMQPSNEGYCVDDSFSVTDCLKNKLCGENKNQHIYVNFNEDSEWVTFLVDISSARKSSRLWNMEIKQISCNSNILAPSGCLMYHSGTTGTVSSFNFGELRNDERKRNRQIRGLHYGVCVQAKNEYCSIEWAKDVDPYSFTISGNSSLVESSSEYLGRQGEICKNSFIIIPNAYRNGQPLYSDRFCGSSFHLTSTFTKPYVLHVVMGENKSALLEDEGNHGFKLNFRQLPCQN